MITISIDWLYIYFAIFDPQSGNKGFDICFYEAIMKKTLSFFTLDKIMFPCIVENSVLSCDQKAN